MKLLATLLISSTPALASPLLYPSPGYPVASTTLTASATGAVTATFVSASSDAVDRMGLFDQTTGQFFGYTLSNRQTAGQVTTLGSVTVGDALELLIVNTSLSDPHGYYLSSGGTPNLYQSSDATKSTDDVSEVYAVSTADGLQVGFEDIPHLADHNYPGSFYTDSDYNDAVFDLSGVTGSSVAATPEPTSLALLGTGLLSGVAVLRRRLK